MNIQEVLPIKVSIRITINAHTIHRNAMIFEFNNIQVAILTIKRATK
jgi:hypothetical protein